MEGVVAAPTFQPVALVGASESVVTRTADLGDRKRHPACKQHNKGYRRYQ